MAILAKMFEIAGPEGIVNMVTVKATQMKNKLGHYLQVAMAEPVVVEKTNQQVAVLMSIKEYERLVRLEDAYWGERAKVAEAEGYLNGAETKEFIESSLHAKA
jgi:prevent-host-death family protein